MDFLYFSQKKYVFILRKSNDFAFLFQASYDFFWNLINLASHLGFTRNVISIVIIQVNGQCRYPLPILNNR